ncbi:MAG: DUF1343 domain-containing protein [Verrucomicrobiales bacterium]|nr:DUF1343 domain-containing protein [Verrucomicrobiales bacterium]
MIRLLFPALLFAVFLSPLEAGLKKDKLIAIDAAIQREVNAGRIPGGVFHLESKGETHRAVFGSRAKTPAVEAMTEDTIFDAASLSKVMSTAPSIVLLHERGLLDVDAKVSEYIPEFLEGGVHEKPKDSRVKAEDRKKITVKHLLTHRSGLPPAISYRTENWWGHETGIRKAILAGLVEPPDSRFRYSDTNYIVLGEIVRRVSGKRLDEFAEENLFGPLEMTNTGYRTSMDADPKIAPTTLIPPYGMVRGEVHDPVARRMQGVAGHAGIFTTVDDVVRFARMFVNKGELDGVRVFKEETIDLITQTHVPSSLKVKRGLGWDIDSGFAYQRGERFPKGGYGHTGWTGTSIWIDPKSESFVIFLANRNHPTEKGRIKDLRIKIGTLAGEAVGYTEKVPLSRTGDPGDASVQTAADPPGTVLNGIDTLAKDDFAALKGLKIGLVTNHTGIDRNHRSTIDLLHEAASVDLVALFSPEHGIRGKLETSNVDDSKDPNTGLPIFSLYKTKSRKPTATQLAGVDALVFDIQDIGCRFYTYISTMGNCMEAAADHGKKFIVLDRVNPIGGTKVDGPVRLGNGNNFTAYHDISIQHGMTVGELAKMFQVEKKLKLDLAVVPVTGWKRDMLFDETGLPWINPSPNMRNLTEAILYPGIGLLEFTNISVGRGTLTPFELIGAPWISEGELASRLEAANLPGIRFTPIRFTPDASVYKNEDCGGVRFTVTDRDELNALDVGITLAITLHDLYPETYNLEEKGNVLLRHQPTLKALLKKELPEKVREEWEPRLGKFKERRKQFLIYE